MALLNYFPSKVVFPLPLIYTFVCLLSVISVLPNQMHGKATIKFTNAIHKHKLLACK